MALAAACLAALLTALPAAAAESYTIDPRHTFPSFEVSHLGFSTQRGRFNKTSGRITLDREKKTGTMEIVIDPDSVDTGVAQLEAVLRGEQYFDTERHWTAVFRASRIEFEGERPARIPGEFTLRGVTRPLTLAVTAFHCGLNPIVKKEACGADAIATLRRSDFGLVAHLPMVGDEIRLSIQVEAFKD